MLLARETGKRDNCRRGIASTGETVDKANMERLIMDFSSHLKVFAESKREQQ